MGVVEEVRLHSDAAAEYVQDPLQLAVYNWTGDEFAGFHYDPVYIQNVVPPPPVPPAEYANLRKRRRQQEPEFSVSMSRNEQQQSSASKTESASHSASVEFLEVTSTEFYQISTLGTDNQDDDHGDRRDLLHAALAFVAENLREESTLPANPAKPEMVDADALREDIAVELPITHCAFRGCAHTFESTSELTKHIVSNDEHRRCLAAVTQLMNPSSDSEEVRMLSAYNESIAMKIRQGAPLDTYSIDRRAILNYSKAAADDQIYMPICFSCARRFPYMASLDKPGEKGKNEIRWHKALCYEKNVANFFSMDPQRCADIFGLDVYIQRYGHLQGFPDMRQHIAEFDDWQLIVPFAERPLSILCCPEDRCCKSQHSHKCLASKTLCKDCEIPMCRYCEFAVMNPNGAQMPLAALINDLMIFYAPSILYEKKVTMMEMICASVCLTTMISFTLEKKYRGKEQRLLDQSVHMQRHTIGTRGNATSFPMPWQEILKMLQDVDQSCEATDPIDLPHTGEKLFSWVQVLLKTSGDDGEDDMKGLVHQATVRADVVVALIEELKNRGHRAYKDVDMERVRRKAYGPQGLPQNGVPPEIVQLLQIKSDDDSLDRIQIQKEATPVPARCQTQSEASKIFEFLAPNAVVCERTNEDGVDVVAQRAAAFQDIGALLEKSSQGTAKSFPEPDKKKPRKVAVSAGNVMIDQFKPWYYGVAFAFMFSFCTGMPDCPAFQESQRYRRQYGAPRVEHPVWDKIMARRAEGQLVRDWQMGFVSWNCRFKTAVNLSRTLWSYETVKQDGKNVKVTAQELEAASIAIVKALRGSYTNPGSGQKIPVNGDLTKLKYVPRLSPVARRILNNAEATTRKMSGTQETRRQMRFDTNAFRVKYGVPIFVTFSPDEKHNLLMMRLSRTRRKDPVSLWDAAAALFGSLKAPKLGQPSYKTEDSEDVFLALSPESLQNQIPDYDTRRALIAKDSLASVDGFRVMVLLAYEHLFGMRVCPNCPHCNHDDHGSPCQDCFGSNAKPEGGVFGRVDAGYTSIEAQKSTGALHAHSQLFVQCLHQHEPLSEVLKRLAQKPELVERYLRYKEHVCRTVFADDDLVQSWEQARRKEVESTWPEYRSTTILVETPQYMLDKADGNTGSTESGATLHHKAFSRRLQQGKAWLHQFLHRHVQRLQEFKQHHVHIWDEEKKEYAVLDHCKSKDKKNTCKSHFPRTKWLIGRCVVLCKGLLQEMEMPSSGRKNLLGALHGPMNEANINGTHPAMLATQQCNSDVQLPYRLPISKDTHSSLCPLGEQCLKMYDVSDIVKACQLAQDAQAGYACDYQNKRQPCGCNEVRECCSGLTKLGHSLQNKPLAYQGKRYMGRILCHAYNNGIVRSAVENRNLRAYAREHDVTFAESFRTSCTTTFAGIEFIQMVDKVNANKIVHFQRDMRNPSRARLTSKNMAMLYGHRSMTNAELKYLSPYEFTMYWEPKLLRYPQSIEQNDDPACHAKLTAGGLQKLKGDPATNLIPGIDYVVKNQGDKDWQPLDNEPGTASLRHEWILQRRRRPMVPQFKGCPLPKHKPGSAEQNAKISMVYFHPWTLREACISSVTMEVCFSPKTLAG